MLDSNTDAAYELAKAGIRMGRFTGTQSQGTFNMPDANHTFTITIASNGTNWVISSTGTVNTGFWQTSRLLTYAVPTSEWSLSSSTPGGGGSNGVTIGGPGTGTSTNPWGPNTGTSAGAGGTNPNAVSVNTANGTINLGGGSGNTDSYGAIWYNGSSLVNNCNSGACSFGSGLYVYFEFVNSMEDYSADSNQSADGFTFAVISALTNLRSSSGGAPTGISMGELMGYAGPGNTANGLGLAPPKMAIEFDTYPNAAGNMCASPSRNDANAGSSSFMDHAALIFWGARSPSGSEEPSGETVPGTGQCTVGGTNYSDASFDDNVHGAGGTGTDPQNSSRPSSPNPGSGYYEGPKQECNVNAPNTCNWMKDGYKYSVRVEIVRPGSSSGTDANGTYYYYTVKAWILSWNPSCNTANTCFSNAISSIGLTVPQQLDFQDIIVPFTDIPAQISVSNVKIYQADHTNLSTVFFGFTEATGAETQQITLGNINGFFPSGNCQASSYSISPVSSSPASTAGNYSFQVSASSGCPWVAATNVSWIQFPVTTPPSNNGSGNGTVSYNVLTNSCPTARTGYINIPGQTFTVTQVAGSGFSSYTVTNNYGGHFSVEGGQYGTTCTRISNGSTFSVNCGDTSAVNVYSHTDDTCAATPVVTVTYALAVAADVNKNGKVQINSSYQLVDN